MRLGRLADGTLSWALTLALSGVCLAYNFDRGFHHAANVTLSALHVPAASSRVGVDLSADVGNQPAVVGDYVQGYPVSSGFGMRTHPITGVQKMHAGVDLAAPIGTPIFAPAVEKIGAEVRVSCWEDVGGGTIAMISSDLLPGQTIRLLHLSECFAGSKKEGEVVGLVGSSGYSTGPHLHAEKINQLGKAVQPTVGLLSWLMTGKVPEDAGMIAYSQLSDDEIVCGIGAAEGTRDQSCQATSAYSGHTDPGNGAANMGTFSYQHGAATPEEADQKQMLKLRAAEKIILKKAEEAGVTLSKLEVLSVLDQFNQSEAAAMGREGTLDRIIEARSNSYLDPDTQQLDAPGLGNDMTRVQDDQRRRTEAIEQILNTEGKNDDDDFRGF